MEDWLSRVRAGKARFGKQVDVVKKGPDEGTLVMSGLGRVFTVMVGRQKLGKSEWDQQTILCPYPGYDIMPWFCTMFPHWEKWAKCTKDLFAFFLKMQMNPPATTRSFSPLWAPALPLAPSTLGPSQMICEARICHSITDSAAKEPQWVGEPKTKAFSLYITESLFS